MPKMRPARSSTISAATLNRRRPTVKSVARVKTYGRTERMSSTGTGCGSTGAAGFVLTGASVRLG
jgi:hypothetical protein